MIYERPIKGILFRYDSQTGKIWRLLLGRKSHKEPPRWKEVALTPNGKGYKTIKIATVKYLAHRVAWYIVNGRWPAFEIDHEDHDRANNIWGNLKEATHAQNAKNNSLNLNNTSGVCGIDWAKRDQTWRARITVNGKSITLGFSKSLSKAIFLRKAAEKQYGFHPNHGAARDTAPHGGEPAKAPD